MEAVNKVCRKAPAPITVATVFTVDEAEAPSGDVARLSDLDPRIPEEEIRAHPVEDLLPYNLDPERPERTRRSSVPRTSRLGWTRSSVTSPSPSCPRTGKKPGGSGTPRQGLMTGHRPELDVPDQDPPALAGTNLYGPRTTGLMTGHRPELDVPDQDPLTGSQLQPTKVGVG
ncbi:hypothetical protein TIFTF001_021552 [Ficus carica]|uniref:Uncharacterized protein n=1 Tax=Ficus carica TaxID=3494 RepID=A0AA88DEQ8_FICCA|nr:hypothetical protein TIFTF001_021552 [Ficus carica]